MFRSEKMIVQMKILGTKIIFRPKNVFGFKKDFGSKKILGPNNFGSKKIYVKKIWVHKFLGPENIRKQAWAELGQAQVQFS